MSKSKFLNRYNLPRSTGVVFDPIVNPSKTLQSYAYETDIHNILRGATCDVPATRKPIFGQGLPPVNNLQDAFQLIADSKNKFFALDSALRARFDNDPQKMIEFIQNDKNRDECYKLGLLNKPVEKGPIEVTVVNNQPSVAENPSEVTPKVN